MSFLFVSAFGRAAFGQAQLHYNDKVHKQTREPQTHDEPTERQEPQHPVWGLSCI